MKKDDKIYCIFCDSEINYKNEKMLHQGTVIHRVNCEKCDTLFFLSQEGIDYYLINMGDTVDRYMLFCEVGPNISHLYHNGSIIVRDIPAIFNPKEASMKLKTLLVFS